MFWRSERHAMILYRSLQNIIVDLSKIKTFGAYDVNFTQAKMMIMDQNIQDFKNFTKNYSDEIEINKDKACISDYRGDWGEDEIH